MNRLSLPLLAALVLFAVPSCSKDSPLAPSASVVPKARATAAPASGRPGYEQAYVNGHTVTINAIDVKNKAPMNAQADLYETVYPIGWESLGLAPPQCNPCDHEHNGIDFTDYHDHILDSEPSSPGHGEYSPLWHVYVVIPAYSGDADHDMAVSAAYAAHLPTKSEDAVNDLLAARDSHGAPIAVKIDAKIYFLCAVVNPNAQP
jgi:hypothetical protein